MNKEPSSGDIAWIVSKFVVILAANIFLVLGSTAFATVMAFVTMEVSDNKLYAFMSAITAFFAGNAGRQSLNGIFAKNFFSEEEITYFEGFNDEN